MKLEYFLFVVCSVIINSSWSLGLSVVKNSNSQVIYWNIFEKGHWAYFCDFPNSNTLNQVETNMLTTCRDQCEEISQCSHFTWDASTLICKLKNGMVYKKDAVYSENGNLGCGLFDLVPRKFLFIFSDVIHVQHF